MKNFAIAALLGLLSVEQVNAHWLDKFSTYHAAPRVYVQANNSDDDSDSDSSSDDETAVQTEDFPAHMNGFGGYKTYIRDTPDRFETEADDTLMKSMYATYATESEDGAGLPSGHFWVTKENAMKACDEVVDTHLRLHKSDKTDYLDANFPALWARFDVNEEGKVEIDRMPQLLRSICGNAEACLGL